MFRIGECYFEQIPGEWWFLPPPAEKDQANTRLAIAAYGDMLNRFPTSDLVEKAQKRLKASRTKLAEHELYVADFYFKRDKYKAAALRADGLLKDYGGLGLDAKALWISGSSHLQDGQLKQARQALERLTKEFPQSDEAIQANDLLVSMPSPAAKKNVSEGEG
jgi:outer membrane protein assembly factor BamD